MELHDAVIYGFPYKLRPKPKIATAWYLQFAHAHNYPLLNTSLVPNRPRPPGGVDGTILAEHVYAFSQKWEKYRTDLPGSSRINVNFDIQFKDSLFI